MSEFSKYTSDIIEKLNTTEGQNWTWEDALNFIEIKYGVRPSVDILMQEVNKALQNTVVHTVPTNKTVSTSETVPTNKTVSTNRNEDVTNISNINNIDITNTSKKTNDSLGPTQVKYDAKTNSYDYDGLVSFVEGEEITPEAIMKKNNIDPAKWKVNSYSIQRKYTATADYDESQMKTVYNSRISIKPKRDGVDIEEIKKYFENYKPLYSRKIKSRTYNLGTELLVPCFYDVHFGKLGWHEEVGEDYDLEIAKEKFIENSNAYISRIKGRKFEKVLYVIGQDFLHSEPNGKTVNNTQQDCDGRYQKIFRYGCEALIESILSFADIAPVDVVLVQGNHSETSEFFMAEFLRAYFRNDQNINIDSSPILRKYYKYGNTLIGLSHGEYEGKRITELMPVEAREDWGETEYHEFLLGHLHSESSFEKGGVTVRRIPSICGTDAWSKKMGYCTSPKRSVAFIYDKEYGLTDTMYQPIR